MVLLLGRVLVVMVLMMIWQLSRSSIWYLMLSPTARYGRSVAAYHHTSRLLLEEAALVTVLKHSSEYMHVIKTVC